MAAKIQSLQEWCQKNTAGYKDVYVIDMTTSWRDGLAFCALINRYKPDILDFSSLSKENVLHNNQMAFRAAENEFGIAPLFDAEDILSNKVPDILAIVTYVSQLYTCFSGMQPIKNKSAIRNGSTKDLSEHGGNKKKPVSLATETKAPVDFTQIFRLCEICKKNIYLVERCIERGKIYHRQCFRAKSLSEMYTREKSPPIENNRDDATKTPELVSEKSSDLEINKTASDCEKVAIDEQDISKCPTQTNSENSSIVTPEILSGGALEKEIPNKPERKNRSPEETLSVATDETNNPELKNVKTIKIDIAQSDNETEDCSPKAINTEDEKEQSQAHTVSSSMPSNSENEAITETTTSSSDAPATGLKVEITTSADDDNLEVQSEDTDVFPPLLEALTDAKETRNTRSSDSISMDNKECSSPLSPFAPLISELPQAPTAKPRTLVSSADKSSDGKPKPKPRSNLSSSNSALDRNQSTEEKKSKQDDYDDSFNPFAMSDFASSDLDEENKESYDDALNPFGNESSDDFEDVEMLLDKPYKSLNPFEDDSDEEEIEDHDKSQKPDYSKPVKMSNANDINSNSIHPGAENKVSNAPLPPSRKKVHAPSPPQSKTQENTSQNSSQAKSPKHTAASFQSPKKTTQALSPGQPSKDAPVKKRAAPNWKLNVEQQMEQMNKLNQTDKKYVNNPQDSASNMPVSPTQSPSRRPNSHRQVKSSRPAPGFGFPLVKRDIKSQMTEDDITKEMEFLHVHLQDMEIKGVQLEDTLRNQIAKEDHDHNSKDESEETLDQWISLICKKNKLARREIDLIFMMQQQRLEQEHADIEFKIRKLLNKPDAEKSDKEKEEESKLLDQLMTIVEKRNTLITSAEEARAEEEEEDVDDNKMRMLRIDSPNDSEAMKKKKKNKMKKMFAKRKKAKASSKTEQPTSLKQVS